MDFDSSDTEDTSGRGEENKNPNPLHQHQDKAAEYLEKHKILKFFENLTAALVYERPEDPKEFARSFIEKLQKAKTDPDVAEPPCLVDDSNLESIFGMLDIAKKGYISHVQYTKAMENLGMVEFNKKPAGSTFNRINKDSFMKEAKAALRKTSTTFTN